MIREALAGLARNESVGEVLARTPVARDAVSRLVAGDAVADAIATAAALADDGYWTALEHTTTPTPDAGEQDAALVALRDAVDAIEAADLAASCEVAVLPEALGCAAGDERLRALAAHAQAAGVDLRLGIGPSTDVPASLTMAAALWADGLDVGVTVPAALRATEAACERLGDRRVRLVKGSLRGEPGAAFQHPVEIDKAFVRCARRLLSGAGTPSFATHDSRLVEIVEDLAVRSGRPAGTFELTFFMGRQEGLQRRLAAGGHRVRVYVPYGPQWFERLVAGLAEQPSSLGSALLSLLPGSS